MDASLDTVNKEVSVDVQIAQRSGRRRSSAGRRTVKKKAPARRRQPPVSDEEKYREHAANWLKKFDADKDGILSKEEWSKDDFTYTTADADKDGTVTLNELAEAMKKK